MGISRHIEMQDLPPVVADDEKAVQNTKGERWDGLAEKSESSFSPSHSFCRCTTFW
jgi:hypothetical protein